jgi:hypothetical protein
MPPKDVTGAARQKRYLARQRQARADTAVIRILHALRDLERQYQNMSPEEKAEIPLYISCFLETSDASRSREGSS